MTAWFQTPCLCPAPEPPLVVSLLHGEVFHDPVSAIAMPMDSAVSLEEHVLVDCNIRLFFALLFSRQYVQIGREIRSEAGPLPMAWIKAGQSLSSCT